MKTHPTSIHRLARTIVIAAGLLGVSAAALGQTTQPAASAKDLPDAVTLIEDSIKAMGGKKAIDAIESSMIKATVSSQGVELKMEMFSMKPDRFFLKQVIPQIGDVTTGSDGTTGWTNDPESGAYQLLDAEQTKQVRKQSNMFRNAMHMLDDYRDHKTVDQLKFNDVESYKISMKDSEDVEQFAYFSVADKLVQGFDITQQTPRGPKKSTIQLSDWKENGDLTIFHRMTILNQGQTIPMVFDVVEFNKVDPTVFDLPAGVKELRDKKSAAPVAPATPTTSPAAPAGGGK